MASVLSSTNGYESMIFVNNSEKPSCFLQIPYLGVEESLAIISRNISRVQLDRMIFHSPGLSGSLDKHAS